MSLKNLFLDSDENVVPQPRNLVHTQSPSPATSSSHTTPEKSDSTDVNDTSSDQPKHSQKRSPSKKIASRPHPKKTLAPPDLSQWTFAASGTRRRSPANISRPQKSSSLPKPKLFKKFTALQKGAGKKPLRPHYSLKAWNTAAASQTARPSLPSIQKRSLGRSRKTKAEFKKPHIGSKKRGHPLNQKRNGSVVDISTTVPNETNPRRRRKFPLSGNFAITRPHQRTIQPPRERPRHDSYVLIDDITPRDSTGPDGLPRHKRLLSTPPDESSASTIKVPTLLRGPPPVEPDHQALDRLLQRLEPTGDESQDLSSGGNSILPFYTAMCPPVPVRNLRAAKLKAKAKATRGSSRLRGRSRKLPLEPSREDSTVQHTPSDTPNSEKPSFKDGSNNSHYGPEPFSLMHSGVPPITLSSDDEIRVQQQPQDVEMVVSTLDNSTGSIHQAPNLDEGHLAPLPKVGLKELEDILGASADSEEESRAQTPNIEEGKSRSSRGYRVKLGPSPLATTKPVFPSAPSPPTALASIDPFQDPSKSLLPNTVRISTTLPRNVELLDSSSPRFRGDLPRPLFWYFARRKRQGGDLSLRKGEEKCRPLRRRTHEAKRDASPRSIKDEEIEKGSGEASLDLEKERQGETDPANSSPNKTEKEKISYTVTGWRTLMLEEGLPGSWNVEPWEIKEPEYGNEMMKEKGDGDGNNDVNHDDSSDDGDQASGEESFSSQLRDSIVGDSDDSLGNNSPRASALESSSLKSKPNKEDDRNVGQDERMSDVEDGNHVENENDAVGANVSITSFPLPVWNLETPSGVKKTQNTQLGKSSSWSSPEKELEPSGWHSHSSWGKFVNEDLEDEIVDSD